MEAKPKLCPKCGERAPAKLEVRWCDGSKYDCVMSRGRFVDIIGGRTVDYTDHLHFKCMGCGYSVPIPCKDAKP